MRIAFFTDTFDPQINGLTVALHAMIRELRERGHTVWVFAPRIKGYQDHDKQIIRVLSIKVLPSEPEAMLPLLLPSRGYKRMFDLDVDLIHAHGNGGFSLLGYLAAKFKRIPFILTFHNDHTKYTHYIFKGKLIKPKLVAYALRFIANLCDRILTPSVKMERELRRYGVRKPIEVIANFLDYKLYQGNDKNYLHKKLNIRVGVPLILSVGRLVKEKNLAFLIRAFKYIAKSNKKVHLVIVGKGPEQGRFEALATRLGVRERVHFTGQIVVSEMPRVYSSASVYVHASVSEVNPMSVMEALASGLPAVVVIDDAYENMVRDGFNGYVCKVNEKEFAQKVLKLLKSREKCRVFGINSRKIAWDNFRDEVVVKKSLNVYESVLKEFEAREKKRQVEVRAKINATAAKIWHLILNVDDYPKFVKFMKRAEIKGVFRPGNFWFDWSTVMFLPIKVNHEIVEMEREKRIVCLVRLPFGGQVIQTLTIEPKGGAVNVKLGATINLGSHLLDSLFGPLLAMRTKAMYAGTLGNVERMILE